MLTPKDFIKQSKEAAAALNNAKRKVWKAFCKEVNDAKGKRLNSKNKKFFECLNIMEQKACSYPDKFVCDLVKQDCVLPQRPRKEPSQHPNGNAVLAVRPPCLAKPYKEPKAYKSKKEIVKKSLK